MKRSRWFYLCNLPIIVLLFAIPITAYAAENSSGSFDEQLDSIELTLDRFGSKVGSTLMFGGSSPISFKGEARLNVQYHSFLKHPYWFTKDRAYIQSGWEGNENLFRLGMVVRAGRNTVLWSKLGFQTTMPGIYNDAEDTTGDGFGDIEQAYDSKRISARIHEDMAAGLAIRTKPASFWLTMGNIKWMEASPLTIWKGQNRNFAWEFLPFEIEQPIARYYMYNIARGEKVGRAAWNKREFNGIRLESITLPLKLHLDVLYAKMSKYDTYDRDLHDYGNDLGYAGDPQPELKLRGTHESYRHIFHTRLAAQKILKGITFGTNFYTIQYNDDIMHLGNDAGNQFKKLFEVGNTSDRGYYWEPSVFSLDAKGDVSSKFSFHADVGLSNVDTTWLIFDTSAQNNPYIDKTETRGGIKPALYSLVKIGEKIPLQFDIAAIAEGFSSPASSISYGKYFWAFGSNMMGPGKFPGASYGQNMGGVQLTVAPKLSGYGHLKVKYGQHVQFKEERDLLFFPYRLNGVSMFSVFQSSYMRWGGSPDFSIYEINNAEYPWFRYTSSQKVTKKKYQKRLGDESFLRKGYNAPCGAEAGGLYSDYMNMYDGFIPYEDSAQAAGNLINFGQATVFDPSPSVPINRKYTFNFELDASYDVGPLIGYKNSLFVGGYTAIHGISTAFKPLAFNAEGEDMQLWSFYIRLEPAIALTNNFYILGLAGYENWRSEKAWIASHLTQITSNGDVTEAIVKKCPINYRDVAFGLGFDLGLTERVQFHGRAKWLNHEDIEFKKYAKTVDKDASIYGKNPNCWSAFFVSGEVKMWF